MIHLLMKLATIWLCCLYIVLHLVEEAPELPWHD